MRIRLLDTEESGDRGIRLRLAAMRSPVESDKGRHGGVNLARRSAVLLHYTRAFLVCLDDAVVQVAGKSGRMIVRHLA
jgi:hypothetical protein